VLVDERLVDIDLVHAYQVIGRRGLAGVGDDLVDQVAEARVEGRVDLVEGALFGGQVAKVDHLVVSRVSRKFIGSPRWSRQAKRNAPGELIPQEDHRSGTR
jgi:hypothetical protein